MTASEIKAALRQKFDDHRQYAVAEEVGLTTGSPHRRLDMIVIDCYSCNRFRIDGFEIKVSTSDLRRELQDPEKHVAFFNVIDYYTIAAPAGVTEPLMDIIPKKWGILIVNENGTTRYKRRPLALKDEKPDDRAVPRGFLASVVRKIQERQPAEEELQKQYDKGYETGKNDEIRNQAWLSNRVQSEAKKLEAYDKLMLRLRIWGDNIDDALDEFEAFRNLDIDWLRRSLTAAIRQLTDLNAKLGEKEADK